MQLAGSGVTTAMGAGFAAPELTLVPDPDYMVKRAPRDFTARQAARDFTAKATPRDFTVVDDVACECT